MIMTPHMDSIQGTSTSEYDVEAGSSLLMRIGRCSSQRISESLTLVIEW